MHALATLARLSILSIPLLSTLAHAHAPSYNRRHAQLRSFNRTAHATSNSSGAPLQKRFDGTRFTYFEVGQNACGSVDHDADHIVALTQSQWDNGAHCYKQINIEYGGKSTTATITDECPGCPYGGLDLSPGLFSLLGGSLDAGVLIGSWSFADTEPAPAPSNPPPPPKPTEQPHTSSPPPPPPPPPSHTEAPPTTSKPPPPPPSSSVPSTAYIPATTSTHSPSSQAQSSTKETPSSASSNVAASSSSAYKPSSTDVSSAEAPAATEAALDTGNNIEQLNLAIIQLVNLANVALVR
ncbi:RlpA-like double-psi beta-barrel-protein domain-containing protein-containing protein [Trametes elegans]|nr:RlpA-like double-psi beta-barrel-protein domain-containing protein-containing protein [Trametes elegans]